MRKTYVRYVRTIKEIQKRVGGAIQASNSLGTGAAAAMRGLRVSSLYLSKGLYIVAFRKGSLYDNVNIPQITFPSSPLVLDIDIWVDVLALLLNIIPAHAIRKPVY